MHRRFFQASFSPSAITAWRTLLGFFAAIIAIVALMPTSQASIAIDSGWDKLNHVVGFAAMGFASCMGWPLPWHRRARGLVLCGVLAFGGLIELLQLAIPEADAEWGDLLADTIGIAIGALPAIALLRLLAQHCASTEQQSEETKMPTA